MEPSNHNLPIVALQQPSHPYDDDAQRLEDDPLLASLPRGSSASGPSRRQSGPSGHHFGSLDSPLGQERYHYFQPAPIARDSISSSSSSSSSSMHPPTLVPSSGQSGLHNYHISAPPGFQLAPITPPAGSPALSDHQGPIDRRQSESQGAATSTPNDTAPAALGSKAPAQPHLKKQQACLTCKRRKTRCDAVRPICGACSRSQARAARGHALTAEVPPGPCTYPDDESAQPGGPSSSSAAAAAASPPTRPTKKQKRTPPSDKSGYGVDDDGQTSASSHSGPSLASHEDEAPSDSKTQRLVIEVQSSSSGGPSRVRRFYSSGNSHRSEGQDFSHPGMNLNNLVDHMVASNHGVTSTDGTDAPNQSDADLPQVDLLLRQIWPEISPDLPTPNTIRHMAELFFAKHPCRHLFCKPTMMARLMLPPNHPLRPHSSLIHAILAAAEPFSPLLPKMRETDPRAGPNGSMTGGDGQPVSASDLEAMGRGFVGLSNPFETPRPELERAGRGISFGEFHLGKARREVEVALLTQNQRPLEWLQAGILIFWCLFDRCRIMECFFIASLIVRSLAPAGFDKMPNDRSHASWNRAIIELPTSSIIEYEQRIALWHVYIIDIYGGGPPKFYEPCLADEKEQITTSLPVLMDDVADETQLRLSDQTLKSGADLFRRGHTDTFCLHVKSACLLKKARTITSRRGPELQRLPQPPQELLDVDSSIRDFFKSFPKRQGVDVDWIVAEANTCVARITLHQHFVGAGLNAQSEYGRGPIEGAAETMMRTVHLLLASSFDLSLLHTQTFICWLVLVRVLDVKARMLRRFWQNEAAAQATSSMEAVMMALRKAAEKSWRAKTSLKICEAAIGDELSDDEFADLVFLWQVIPTS
ncbi:hypothetical protein BDZ90DRAFT_230512 [Jaminaea rosea]|uniref:Zn(2)-C6 fungal-type domain-containing protein n=1 Tax=Jaminaea rosea TaxID=1569628 RepID=A0A316V0E0_9BASI|nr:hypothetical protein BDZ90DRAFT_230512 [Jaminaea rosea]PWN29643.1 hypothetical protein BDZ90DRAFT_230512 [Jaminaea rosea]